MDLDVQVLLPFVKAKGRFVSGTSIGRELGLSRVSVHNHLESLRASGFTFAAIRNKGYQLTREPETFHPVLFRALLEETPCPYFKNHITLEEVDSTNTVAEAELSKGRETPFFVVAESQSAGRGRRGRVWHSPRRKNIYLSAALRPSLPPGKLPTITLWLGLRLCRFLRDTFALPVLVKWPNDIMLHGKKIAGMLTEARIDSEFTRDLVFGVGLNVNTLEKDFPDELASIAGSLALSTGQCLNITRLTHQMVLHLAEAFADFMDGGHVEELARLWPEFDFLRGQRVCAEAIEGVAAGITSTGSLRVQRDDGSMATLHSGEVSIRIN